jgi:hypothetical protein
MKQPPLLDVDPHVRREFDYYPTPAWMTRALMRRESIYDVLEPCSGFDAIANVFRAAGQSPVTSDLNPETPAHWHLDATQERTWEQLRESLCAWTVTNPPFDLADIIVPLAVRYSLPLGGVAMMLRLSWLEPTAARAPFLKANPPRRLIVMPRHDWRGTGSTDSVTSAWFIWDSNQVGTRGIDVVTRDERDELIALERVRS